MKVLFSGGGTLGPVVPLLAVADVIMQTPPIPPLVRGGNEKGGRADHRFVWIGTPDGPERKLVEAHGIRFYAIPSAKLRRYFSLQTILAPLQFVRACGAAFAVLRREKPDLLVSAGGYVSVPVHWAGWILRIPSVVHQQDIAVGLANRLILPCATKVTSAFVDLRGAEKIGNPVRKEIMQGTKDDAVRIFGLDPSVPTVLVLGGGTGARALSEIVADAAPELTQFCNVIHLAGFNRAVPVFPSLLLFSNSRELENNKKSFARRYHQYPFLNKELPHAFAAADLVITRAGLSTLSELVALGKPAIVVPIPHSHQERNAEFFARHGGALLLRQEATTGRDLVVHARTLLTDKARRDAMGRKMQALSHPDAAERLARIILDIHSRRGV